MKLGNVAIDVPVALAPMAGITDLPFRLICRRLGCGYTVSEMISAKGLLYNNTKTKEMLNGRLLSSFLAAFRQNWQKQPE